MRDSGVRVLMGGLLIMVIGMPVTGFADNQAMDRSVGPAAPGKTESIHVDISMSSWRLRRWGGVSLEPSIRIKLKDAGFTVVHAASEPHDLVLRVDYRETRGQEVGFGDYQTDIACTVKLEHPQRGELGLWRIVAAPEDPVAAPVNYPDSLHDFESNPYFFFLGDLVRRAADQKQDTVEVMAQGLAKLVPEMLASGEERTTSNWNPHGPAPYDAPYARVAVEKTIRELARLKDPRAVPVLVSLTETRNLPIRLQAVEALGVLASPESKPALERVARLDPDDAVRRGAARALTQLDATQPVP